MKRLFVFMISVSFGFLAVPAYATLIDRGGGLIYDTDLNITWLQDANYAKTSGYDADGFMTHSVATNWVQSLVYNGINNWRLPYTPHPDPTCGGSPYNCSGGEMSHLYHIEGITSSSPGPFFNFVLDHYWYGIDLAGPTSLTFSFQSGYTGSY